MKALPMPAADWAALFSACKVRAATATRWGPIFASTIKPTTFSKGPVELLDFLPTILHESGRLERLKEDGNYSAARIRELGMKSQPGTRWRALVPRADALAGKPAAFFEAIYGGRLGNDKPGDGALYPGRGLIMLTGKANYIWQGNRSGQDLVQLPSLAEQPTFALEFAIDWWEGKVPDSKLGDSRAIRRVVNGGLFGIEDIDSLTITVRRALA